MRVRHGFISVLIVIAFPSGDLCHAGELIVSIEPGEQVARVGIARRFHPDGTLARKVDPKAKFESPYTDRESAGNSARFEKLPAGTYDVIIFLKNGTRLEGYHWPIFNEFDDPEDPVFDTPPPKEIEEYLREKIAATSYYENKVTPLAFAGGEDQVRVLMQLLRDDKTSFDQQFGAPVATLRYEIWQFNNNFGGWTRDKHSKVLHRILDAKSNVRKKEWLWVRELGGHTLREDDSSIQLKYRLPKQTKTLPGLHPY